MYVCVGSPLIRIIICIPNLLIEFYLSKGHQYDWFDDKIDYFCRINLIWGKWNVGFSTSIYMHRYFETVKNKNKKAAKVGSRDVTLLQIIPRLADLNVSTNPMLSLFFIYSNLLDTFVVQYFLWFYFVLNNCEDSYDFLSKWHLNKLNFQMSFPHHYNIW